MNNFDSVGIARRGKWFAVQRPDGRIGSWHFGSKYRAAEHAERAWKVGWPALVERGVRIVAVAP